MSAAESRNGTTPQVTDQLEADVERQREQLADTVDALQAKLDVKSRAQGKAAELKDRATTDDGRPRPPVVAGAVLALVLVAGLIHLRRRR